MTGGAVSVSTHGTKFLYHPLTYTPNRHCSDSGYTISHLRLSRQSLQPHTSQCQILRRAATCPHTSGTDPPHRPLRPLRRPPPPLLRGGTTAVPPLRGILGVRVRVDAPPATRTTALVPRRRLTMESRRARGRPVGTPSRRRLVQDRAMGQAEESVSVPLVEAVVAVDRPRSMCSGTALSDR